MSVDEWNLEALTEIAQCPLTRESVTIASEESIRRLNDRIGEGRARDAGGNWVQQPVEMGLVSTDGCYLYPILQGVAVMLPSLAIILDETRTKDPVVLRPEANEVKEFYEEFGWKKDGGGEDYVDATGWEDLRPVSREYIRKCHRRLGTHFPKTGTYFLDVASGAVQYPEYVEYSEGFSYRVCVDLSFRALVEARKKLGHRGIFICGDISNLPLRSGVMDTAMSLHTIYHMPVDQQALAMNEIHRVLRVGQAAVIVYSWGHHSKLMRLPNAGVRAIERIRNLPRAAGARLRRLLSPNPSVAAAGMGTIYTRYQGYDWFSSQQWPFKYELYSWRSVSPTFLKTYVHRWSLGGQFLELLYALESQYPRFLGQYGQYAMIQLRKS
jgi:uncharacterized protein YbaR (Trm112 family)